MKIFKVYINYEMTGEILVVANSAEEAEDMAEIIVECASFKGPANPELVGPDYHVLREVTEQVGSENPPLYPGGPPEG